MAEVSNIFVQAIYKNVKNWNVEDIIYLSILNRENISKMYKISHVIISFANYLAYLRYCMTPEFWKIQTSSKNMRFISSFWPNLTKKHVQKADYQVSENKFASGNALVRFMDFFPIYNTPSQKTPWEGVVPGNLPHLPRKVWN